MPFIVIMPIAGDIIPFEPEIEVHACDTNAYGIDCWVLPNEYCLCMIYSEYYYNDKYCGRGIDGYRDLIEEWEPCDCECLVMPYEVD